MTNTMIMVNNNKKGKENKTWPKSDAQCNCSQPADRCQTLLPKLRSTIILGNSLPVYKWNMRLWGVEYPFAQFGSLVLAMVPPSFFCEPRYWQDMRAQNKEKQSLTLDEHDLAKPKASVCFPLDSHCQPKSTALWKKNSSHLKPREPQGRVK